MGYCQCYLVKVHFTYSIQPTSTRGRSRSVCYSFLLYFHNCHSLPVEAIVRETNIFNVFSTDLLQTTLSKSFLIQKFLLC